MIRHGIRGEGMRLLRKSGDVPKRSLWQRDQRRRADGRRRARARRRLGGFARAAGAAAARGGLRRSGDAASGRGGRAARAARLGEDAGRVSAALADGHRRRAARAATAIRALDWRRSRADGDSRRRRERRGQDDVHRQAERSASRGEKKRVMVAAGDTFRAGAIDQLRVWAERTGAEFVGGAGRAPIPRPWRSTRSTRRSRAASTC